MTKAVAENPYAPSPREAEPAATTATDSRLGSSLCVFLFLAVHLVIAITTGELPLLMTMVTVPCLITYLLHRAHPNRWRLIAISAIPISTACSFLLCFSLSTYIVWTQANIAPSSLGIENPLNFALGFGAELGLLIGAVIAFLYVMIAVCAYPAWEHAAIAPSGRRSKADTG